ncbi:hypothetical protein ACLBWS_11990 [Brucellaceae bacterium D45D]
MTAINETLTDSTRSTPFRKGVLTHISRTVFGPVSHHWNRCLNRRQIEKHDALDDLRTAIHRRRAENPTRLLRGLADAERRTEATRV